MSDLTISFTDTLVVVTCWCGINHAVPADLRNYQKRCHDEGSKKVPEIFCPLGHAHVPAGTPRWKTDQEEKERLQRLATQRLARLDQERAEREAAERQAHAYKMVAAKARKRAAAAVCPVEGCGRSFVQIRRHLTAKHPDFDPAEVTA